MAFEEFSQLSKRRRIERAEKFRRNIIIGIVLTLFIILCAGGLYAVTHQSEGSNNDHNKDGSRSSNKNKGDDGSSTFASDRTFKAICAPTDYKEKCEDALAKSITSPDSVKPKAIMKASISASSGELKRASKKTSSFKFEKPEEKAAYDDCKKLFQDALDELDDSFSRVEANTKNGSDEKVVDDIKTWLSAVVSYQEACIDGFPEGKLKTSMEQTLNGTKQLVSNSLALISQLKTVLSKLPGFGGSGPRQLLGNDEYQAGDDDDRKIPVWVDREERELLTKSTAKLVPNVTVAKDGSGDFKTIKEALEKIPEKRQGRYFIYVKQGVYEEYVTVTKKMVNVTMYGDGSEKTVVTGNKNFKDKIPTYQTATFAAQGDRFVAIDMGFRNTAGPEKHQAVALRVQADRAIFWNCRMEAYQDTLYVQCHRQFYRDCVITGTIDFIFGDAAAIFQNCMILVRKPMDGQKNIVIAQGRSVRQENTGIVLQRCVIAAHDEFQKDKFKFKTYLGRPWKDYSRTIILESTIGKIVDPQGWLEWEGESKRLKTLYYAEYNNDGPGSATSGRVKWPGYQKSFAKKDALEFTFVPFLEGMASWVKVVGVPVELGLYKKNK